MYDKRQAEKLGNQVGELADQFGDLLDKVDDMSSLFDEIREVLEQEDGCLISQGAGDPQPRLILHRALLVKIAAVLK